MNERPYPFRSTSIEIANDALMSIWQAVELGAYTPEEARAYQAEVIAQMLMCRLDADQPLPILYPIGPIVSHLELMYALPPYERAKQ